MFTLLSPPLPDQNNQKRKFTTAVNRTIKIHSKCYLLKEKGVAQKETQILAEHDPS